MLPVPLFSILVKAWQSWNHRGPHDHSPSGKLAWWSWDCPEYHQCIHLCYQGCKVILEANRKLTGMAFRVPDPSVLIMDLTCCLEKAAKNDIKKVVKWTLGGPLKDILVYTKDQIVSCNSTMTPTLPPLMLGLKIPLMLLQQCSWVSPIQTIILLENCLKESSCECSLPCAHGLHCVLSVLLPRAVWRLALIFCPTSTTRTGT